MYKITSQLVYWAVTLFIKMTSIENGLAEASDDVTFSLRGQILKNGFGNTIESMPQCHINIQYDNRQAAFLHSSKWMFQTIFINY